VLGPAHQRAIIQSGNTPNVNSVAKATRVGRRLVERLGVPATRAAISAASPERVLQAQAKMRDDLQARPDPAFWREVALTYLPWAPTGWASRGPPGAFRPRMIADGRGLRLRRIKA
jgi:carboxylesterase type B